jgi:hypothetical protein
MPGEVEQLTRRQEAAVAALLAHPTVEAAAKAAGVGERTLRGWLAEPAFAAACRTARLEVLTQTVSGIVRATSKALATLERNLEASSAAVQVQAAKAILDQAHKGIEFIDLETRLRTLEQWQAEKTARPPNW